MLAKSVSAISEIPYTAQVGMVISFNPNLSSS
jgi:hypothetical protein